MYTNDNINLANYSNINYNNEETEYIRSNKNGNFKDTKRIEESNDKGKYFTKYSINDNNISADGRTTQRNDKILNSNEGYNDRSSSNSTYRENIEQEGLDNGSFSLDKNVKQYDDLTKTNIMEYFRKDKVKENTLYGYNNKLPYIKSLYKVKLKDFNYPTFERWHDKINSTHLATRTKNDIYKLLKTIMNYTTAWHEFNFAKVYPKMYNFNEPNEFPKE